LPGSLGQLLPSLRAGSLGLRQGAFHTICTLVIIVQTLLVT